MKHFFWVILCGMTLLSNAQILEKSAIHTGYSYVGRNSVSLGLEYNFPIEKNDWHGLSTGIVARHFKGQNNKSYFIPEVSVSYRYFGLFSQIAISTEHINPNIGVSLLNIIRIYTGYSFSFNERSTNLNGVVFGINLLIGKDEFYDGLKIGF